MRERILRGDQLLMEGAREVAGTAGIAADKLSIHCLPQDEEEIEANVFEILGNKKNLPGIIVRSPKTAESIVKAIRAKGLAPQREAPLAVSDYFGEDELRMPIYARKAAGAIRQPAWAGSSGLWPAARRSNRATSLCPCGCKFPRGFKL